MKPKKIIYLITKSNWGGAQRYVFDLATRLPKDEFEVLVVTGNKGALTEKLEGSGIKVVNINSLKRDVSFFDEILSFFEILKIFIKEKPGIIHLNSSKAGGIGALAGRIAGIKKIIFTAHGWPFEEDRNFLSKFLIYSASYITILLSHQSIVVTKKDFQIAQRFWAKIKVTLIPIGIDSNYEIISKEESRKTLSEKFKFLSPEVWKQNIIIGSVGELTKNKGYIFALEAMAQLKKEKFENFFYLIIGEGEDEKMLKERAEKLGLSSNVFFLGFVPNTKIIMTAFDIFLFPSIKEGLPYTILEAGIAKLPVIASDVGGVPDVIENCKGGILVPKKDPQAITKAIKENITNSAEFGEELHKTVTKSFTFKQMFEKTIALYIPKNSFLESSR